MRPILLSILLAGLWTTTPTGRADDTSGFLPSVRDARLVDERADAIRECLKTSKSLEQIEFDTLIALRTEVGRQLLEATEGLMKAQAGFRMLRARLKARRQVCASLGQPFNEADAERIEGAKDGLRRLEKVVADCDRWEARRKKEIEELRRLSRLVSSVVEERVWLQEQARSRRK